RLVLAAFDGRLELTPRRELRHRGRGDRHLLGRIPRVHALALFPVLCRELPEAGERHFAAAPQCVCDRVEERVYGPRRIPTREARFRRDLVYELLFRQVLLLLSTDRTTGQRP